MCAVQDPVRTVGLLERVLVERPQLCPNWDLTAVLLSRVLEVSIQLLHIHFSIVLPGVANPDPDLPGYQTLYPSGSGSVMT